MQIDDAETFRERLYEILPKSSKQDGYMEAIMQLIDDEPEYDMSGARAVSAHIPTSTQTFGDWTLGVDAAGNGVEIDFGLDRVEPVY